MIALLLFWVLLTDRDRCLRERRQARAAAKPADDRDPWSQRILARQSLLLTFVLGVALSLPGAPYLAALKDISEAELATGASVLLILAYNLSMFSFAAVPLLGIRAGTRADARAGRGGE